MQAKNSRLDLSGGLASVETFFRKSFTTGGLGGGGERGKDLTVLITARWSDASGLQLVAQRESWAPDTQQKRGKEKGGGDKNVQIVGRFTRVCGREATCHCSSFLSTFDIDLTLCQ